MSKRDPYKNVSSQNGEPLALSEGLEFKSLKILETESAGGTEESCKSPVQSTIFLSLLPVSCLEKKTHPPTKIGQIPDHLFLLRETWKFRDFFIAAVHKMSCTVTGFVLVFPLL